MNRALRFLCSNGVLLLRALAFMSSDQYSKAEKVSTFLFLLNYSEAGGMSTLIQKLAKTTPSSLKLFRQSRLNPRLHPTPTLIPHQTVLGSTRPERSRDSSRFLGRAIDENVKSSQILQLYPVFPFGFCANPNPISSAVLDGAEPVEGDDSRRMWADSVKKKRKRKMNKHKYKKLRKRLRRKAKS